MAEKFTLPELINRAVARGARNLLTCLPAKVTKWDASTGKANCQILVQDAYEDEEGNRQVVSFPVVAGCVVQFQGAGGYHMSCPISDGNLNINGQTVPATMGTLFFAARSLDQWLSGSGAEVDPQIDHDHALTDAIFMPGLMPFGAPWKNMPTNYMSIGSDTDGNSRINLKPAEIDLGEGASKGVARKGDPAGGGTIAFTFTPGPSAALAIIYTPGDGSAPQNLAAGTGTLSLKEAITGASMHVNAVD